MKFITLMSVIAGIAGGIYLGCPCKGAAVGLVTYVVMAIPYGIYRLCTRTRRSA